MSKGLFGGKKNSRMAAAFGGGRKRKQKRQGITFDFGGGKRSKKRARSDFSSAFSGSAFGAMGGSGKRSRMGAALGSGVFEEKRTGKKKPNTLELLAATMFGAKPYGPRSMPTNANQYTQTDREQDDAMRAVEDQARREGWLYQIQDRLARLRLLWEERRLAARGALGAVVRFVRGNR
jgi:hypothetical protein